ncbi:MAG TPA: hypothetical protein VE890_12175 [Thermoguttaceae bacterium]|nr:hypothetical protein [Thermoguttaceae bacterium]
MNRQTQQPPKHGIYITEHKHWNTKEIFNAGRRMARYGHQPKTLRFRSPMVNDFNQHLCGGWTMLDIPDEKQATVNRVIDGTKPFGDLRYCEEDQDEAIAAKAQLDQNGLPTRLESRPPEFYQGETAVYGLTFCRHGTLADLFDLNALALDYRSNVPDEDIETEIETYRRRTLQSFFGNWEVPAVPRWLTGLLLGYPVENTISIYLKQVR